MNTFGPNSPDVFEAVYYSQPVPRTSEALTLLGLVFDRVYFPAVYMPPTGFDEKWVANEIQRILDLRLFDPNTVQMLRCMSFAKHCKHLGDFCVFTGKPGMMDSLEKGTHDVVNQLEEMVFGPRPEGEIPVATGPWVKGLGGPNFEFQVSAPDTVTYPANALLFAENRGLPLINDLPGLPVPGICGDPKGNAKLLATILAIESVSLVLPNLNPLTPEALRDFRQELAQHVRPFRLAMLKLAKELNLAIQSGAPAIEVQRQARFLVEADVYPRLIELDGVIKKPGKPWYRRAVELVKDAPELAASFASLPAGIAKVLIKTVEVLANKRDDQLEKDRLMKSGLYYLLKIKDINV